MYNLSGASRIFTRPISSGLLPGAWLAVLVCMSFHTHAVQVTFKVDMSQVVISPNGVHIAGSFQGWNPSATPMTHVGNGIYCHVADLPPGTHEFKFINGNAWGPDELVPAACGVNNGLGVFNRQVLVGSTDLVLDLVCFGQCGMCTNGLYSLNGNAVALGGNCYALTNASTGQNGTVWYGNQLDLAQSFDLQFLINLGNLDGGGADGVAFALQRLGTNAIGVSGGGMGFQSFTTAFGVEFDTYQNFEFNDPAADHIAVQINGNVDHNSPQNITGPVQMSASSANTEDGQNHVVQITWDPATFLFQVFFDCNLRISLQYNISSNVFSGQTMVYWGFTGATGALFNVQQVCLQSSAVQVNDVTMCPGGSVQLSGGSSSTGIWSWTPSEWLDNPSSATPIASPPATTVYSVTVTDLCNNSVTRNVTVTVLPEGPPCSIAPVALASFAARRSAASAVDVVEWSTYAEYQNALFTVERSRDGWQFESAHSQPGAGDSFFPLFYEARIPHQHEAVYYRLRQTDRDGTSVIASPVVRCASSDAQVYTAVRVSGSAVRISGPFDGTPVELLCYSSGGALVHHLYHDPAEGEVWMVELPQELILARLVSRRGPVLWSGVIP